MSSPIALRCSRRQRSPRPCRLVGLACAVRARASDRVGLLPPADAASARIAMWRDVKGTGHGLAHDTAARAGLPGLAGGRARRALDSVWIVVYGVVHATADYETCSEGGAM